MTKPAHSPIIHKIYNARYDWTWQRFEKSPPWRLSVEINNLMNKREPFYASECWQANQLELWAAIDALSDILIKRGEARLEGNWHAT